MTDTYLKPYALIDDSFIEWQKNFKFFRFVARNHNSAWGEGFFSRILYNPELEEYCVQVVSYYRYQLIPFHINDYHPFFIYYDKKIQPLRLIYDPGHHNSNVAKIEAQTQNLTIIYPWHPFELGKKKFSLPLVPVYRSLHNDVLLRWWLQPGMPQFKLRSKLVDPWHLGLLSNSKMEAGSFRDEITCPVCGKIHLFDRMDFDGKRFSSTFPCCKNTIITAIYDPENMRMSMEINS
ncbi:MAG: hypothetical protein CVU44_02495 [Chloroflexi bacterium HGW-Chloroflexi-6]|nr:MAG: hypothetical protein CVU44_02495 [Chloroflexi bacterium HGW-Chloroflexi-6]